MPQRRTPVATTGVLSVERTALLSRLREHADVPVVVVRAGAGYGKSTLAEQWAQQDPRTHAVVRVARYLDHPAPLALTLIDALESVGPSAVQIRDVVTGAEPAFSAVLMPAITRLAASRGGPFVLVVDDVHLLTHAGCHELLASIAEGVPPGSQIALLTRAEPPLWLARTRAEGRLLELGTADLAFDDEESRRLLDGLGITSRDQADALVARAEGWPVGLYLTALALRSRGNAGVADARIAPTGSDQFVVDYLRAEVLGGLPPRVREFLRWTSVLDELDAALCDAVVGRRDSAAVLSRLSRDIPLVMTLDPEGLRFRYHHLLVDALRADLVAQEPWRAPDLHLRAAEWYASRGDREAAIRHAKAAGDLHRTGRLVWAGVPGCIASGHPDTLGSWLTGLDDVEIRSDRWLTLAAAWLGLQTGDPDRMTRWTLAAEDHAGPDWIADAAGDEYAASLAAVHVVIGDHGLDGTIDLCRAMRHGLPRDSAFRAAAFQNEGVALTLTRRFPEGLACLHEAERLGRALGVPLIEANALAWEGMLTLLSNDWGHGAPLVARAGDLIRHHRLDRLATSANCVTALALLQAARGHRDEARVTLGAARRLTAKVSQIAPWFAVAGRLVQARTAILLDDGALARTLCSEAARRLGPGLTDTLLSDLLTDTEAMLRVRQSQGGSAATLTAAELRVLPFLPSRLTFQQIGEHLFLSQTTIKTHALAIYRKLGASSRDDAVARARALGLVESLPTD